MLFYLYSNPADGKVIWFQEILRKLLGNWSNKGKVKLETFSLGTFWKVKSKMCLITTPKVEVVGLHILLSNINGSARLRDGAVTVRAMLYYSYFIFDPTGILIGLEKL